MLNEYKKFNFTFFKFFEAIISSKIDLKISILFSPTLIINSKSFILEIFKSLKAEISKILQDNFSIFF